MKQGFTVGCFPQAMVGNLQGVGIALHIKHLYNVVMVIVGKDIYRNFHGKLNLTTDMTNFVHHQIVLRYQSQFLLEIG